ncbi:MAG: sulfotransferase domain-containing protein [Spirochaeta sp.]|jgi:glycosyltransferase involved in cell wall biosynthesis|nr:sulfotransferase domain-containing protein [Spirochaeta sp.]
MKVAVITPYHNESRSTLQRVIGSVQEQTAPVDHFLVADGTRQAWIDEVPGIRHVHLDRAHSDYGATPRMTGFLLATAETYQAIAFLDADHWLGPDHVARCLAIAADNENLDFVIPRRQVLRADGSPLPLEDEEIDEGFIDTSCHFLLPGAYSAVATWGTARKPAPRNGPRHIFLYNLASEPYRAAWIDEPTVFTTCRWASVYHHVGETPPPEASPISRRPIWVLGDGRSGTTWLFELINYHYRYRAFFEPFNPGPSKPGVEVGLHRYLHPEESHRDLEKHLADIFSGRFNEARRPNARSALYHRVLLKDIYANLFAHWAHQRFPDVKIVLLIRNPFAVAASKLNVQHWFPKSDLDLILSQERLVADHLREHLPLLHKVARKNDFVINKIAIWAVINSVPLQQFGTDALHAVGYEDLMENPPEVLKRLFAFLDDDQATVTTVPSQQIIDRPSSSTVHRSTEGPEQILPSEKPEKWELVLTREQIRWGERILQSIHLPQFYSDRTTKIPD